MKATGIVRRIDDLGRVVIPKEIRRTMRIREGDPSHTTVTPIDRFCIAIHSISERIKQAECNHSAVVISHKIVSYVAVMVKMKDSLKIPPLFLPVMVKRSILRHIFILRSSKGKKPIVVFFIRIDCSKAVMPQIRKEY